MVRLTNYNQYYAIHYNFTNISLPIVEKENGTQINENHTNFADDVLSQQAHQLSVKYLFYLFNVFIFFVCLIFLCLFSYLK